MPYDAAIKDLVTPSLEPDDRGYIAMDAVDAYFNQRFVIITDDDPNPTVWDTQDPRPIPTRSFDSFIKQNQNIKVRGEEGNGRGSSAARIWLSSHGANRKRYYGFYGPEDCPADHMNIWRGFAIAPAPGPCDIFHEILHDLVAQKDESLYSYVLDLLAWTYQNPLKPSSVLLELRSDAGLTGKSATIQTILQPFGINHARTEAHAKRVVKNFNNAFRYTAVCFLEEVNGLSYDDVDVLKAIMDSPVLEFEPKGKDSRQGTNHVKFFASTNREGIPRSPGERRILSCEVSTARQADHDYFRSLRRQMDGGGYAGFLHEMLSRDISAFDPAPPPTTKAMITAVQHGLNFQKQWAYKLTTEGFYGLGWPERVSASEARADFNQFLKGKDCSRSNLARCFKELICLGAVPDREPTPTHFAMPTQMDALLKFETDLVVRRRG